MTCLELENVVQKLLAQKLSLRRADQKVTPGVEVSPEVTRTLTPRGEWSRAAALKVRCVLGPAHSTLMRISGNKARCALSSCIFATCSSFIVVDLPIGVPIIFAPIEIQRLDPAVLLDYHGRLDTSDTFPFAKHFQGINNEFCVSFSDPTDVLLKAAYNGAHNAVGNAETISGESRASEPL